VSKRPSLRLSWLFAVLACAAACSRSGAGGPGDDGDSAGPIVVGNDAAIERVREAARALAEPGPTVDFVAAKMEGAIKARTKSQALILYDGYRATLTTPADQVTRITFDLTEAKPTIRQLSAVFGKPEQVPKGMLYRYEAHITGATILILAEPVSLPAEEGSLVHRILIEGARTR
jgi:hypothetical protein